MIKGKTNGAHRSIIVPAVLSFIKVIILIRKIVYVARQFFIEYIRMHFSSTDPSNLVRAININVILLVLILINNTILGISIVIMKLRKSNF